MHSTTQSALGSGRDPNSLVEPMLESIGAAFWHLARVLTPEELEGAILSRILHWVETTVDREGHMWFNKSCRSNRTATSIVNSNSAKGNNKQWCIYPGGGAVDIEQPELLQGALVLATNGDWAALTVIVVWLVTCGCPCGERAFCDERLIFTEEVGKKDADPLLDEELQPAPEKRDLGQSAAAASEGAYPPARGGCVARGPLAEEELEEDPPEAAAPNDENAVSERFCALCKAMGGEVAPRAGFRRLAGSGAPRPDSEKPPPEWSCPFGVVGQ